MAYTETTPADQPTNTLDLGALTIGVSKVICDGSWLGSLKEGTGVTLNLNPTDKLIVVGQHPGTTLGKRNLGTAPTIRFEAIESTLANIRKFMDLEATVKTGRLSFGGRNKVATEHSLDIYSEGPDQRTRKLSLYRVTLEVDGDINWAVPDEFTSFTVVARVLPNLSMSEDQWFGEWSDTPVM